MEFDRRIEQSLGLVPTSMISPLSKEFVDINNQIQYVGPHSSPPTLEEIEEQRGRDYAAIARGSLGPSTEPTGKDIAMGALTGGPVGTAYNYATNPNIPAGARIGAAGMGLGSGALGLLGGPATGLVGILGGIFNAMGAYQDPNEVTGNLALSNGVLSGDMDPSTTGGGFYQTGKLNNDNFLQDAAINNPDMMIDTGEQFGSTTGARNVQSVNEAIVDQAWANHRWDNLSPEDQAIQDLNDRDDVGGGGDSGGGDDGGTVLCTALHAHGIMPDKIFKADKVHGKNLPTDVINGYHAWAKPIARQMHKRKWLAQVLSPLILPWATEIAYREGVIDKGSLIGKVYMVVGVPICSFIGSTIKQRGYNEYRV
tara:strand:+ start:285 stop:1388 length:1104 start_codon:yes stop_codon:yes gene_type:complete